MAISYSAEAASICQEAMFLLRQDTTVPSSSTAWDANEPIEWWKCRVALETAVNEVVSAFVWKTTVTAENIASWPAKVRTACVYCLARECAIPIAGRIEDMKVMDAIYHQKMTAAKITDLNEYVKESTDPVLLQLVANFKADDPALVTAYAVYTQRALNVKLESDKEVKKILNLNTLDDLAQQASYCLSVSNLASSCGIDANVVQLKKQEYHTKILQWRKIKLDDNLATNTDPVLAQLVSNFKGDDEGLLNAYTAYTKRADAVKTDSDNTVKDILGIGSATLTGAALEASYCLSVAKLAPVCGLDVNFANLKKQEYDSLIEEMKRNKLDDDIVNKTGMYIDCAGEVQTTLGITAQAFATDKLAIACANALCYSNNGEHYGYDANFAKIKLDEYNAKILQWRKLKLESDRIGDAILDQLVGSFRGDDASLCNAWSVYAARKTQTLTVCENAVKTLLDVTTLDGLATAAVNTLAVAKLSHVFGLDGSSQMEEYERMATEMLHKKLSSAIADSTTSIFVIAMNEVKKTLGITSSDPEFTTPDQLMTEAAGCLAYAKHGAEHRYDAEFVKSRMMDYQSKIAEWRKLKLNKQLETETDPVLNEILMNFKGDDAGLLNAYTAYTHRSSTVRAESDKEVKEILGITILDDLAQQASYSLSVSKLAISCGMSADFANLKKQEYMQKVQEWRKVKLNAALAANTDPMLAELIANFKSDDAGLANAFTVYTQRVSATKTAAVIEINNAHSWRTAFTDSSKTHIAYPAFIELVCSKLALACGLDANAVQLFENKYQKRLEQARIADLDAAKAAITDSDTKEVLSLILADFSEGGYAPRSIGDITDRIDAAKDIARKDVLLAHDWSFAKNVEETTPTLCENMGDGFMWSIPYPRNALRLITCYGKHGCAVEWRVESGLIVSNEPVVRIRYTRDVADLGKWKAFAKLAYIRRIAALVARTVMNSAQEASIQEQLYQQALQNAKLSDTKEANTPEVAWGDNYYVDRMRRGGRFPRNERGMCYWR